MARKTEQRRVIRQVFENTDRPLTPQEVLDIAQKEMAGMGIATVYRNLKNFHIEGWLTMVELPGQPARYERSTLSHHHHFHCDTCGKVFDIPGCPNDLDQIIPEHFHVRRHEVLLYGDCSECGPVETTEDHSKKSPSV